MKINIIRGILIILLLGTFWLIFGFSNQNSKESKGISMKVSEGIINITGGKDSKASKTKRIKKLEPIIRKLAHFSIYTVVGFLLMALASTYKLNDQRRLLIALIVGFLYACSDEIHQLFVSRKKWRSKRCIDRYNRSLCRNLNLFRNSKII